MPFSRSASPSDFSQVSDQNEKPLYEKPPKVGRRRAAFSSSYNERKMRVDAWSTTTKGPVREETSRPQGKDDEDSTHRQDGKLPCLVALGSPADLR